MAVKHGIRPDAGGKEDWRQRRITVILRERENLGDAQALETTALP